MGRQGGRPAKQGKAYIGRSLSAAEHPAAHIPSPMSNESLQYSLSASFVAVLCPWFLSAPYSDSLANHAVETPNQGVGRESVSCSVHPDIVLTRPALKALAELLSSLLSFYRVAPYGRFHVNA
jgi:hypothetical protein